MEASATLQLMHEDYSYTNIHHCLEPESHSHSWINWSNVSEKLPQSVTWQHMSHTWFF